MSGVAALFAGGAEARGRPRMWQALKYFTVDLPPGFLILPARLAIDTVSANVLRGRKPYVFITLGDTLYFPVEDEDKSVRVEEHSSNPVKTASVVTDGQRRISEYYWETPSQIPSQLIAVAYTMSPDQQPVADRIAASVRPKPHP